MSTGVAEKPAQVKARTQAKGAAGRAAGPGEARRRRIAALCSRLKQAADPTRLQTLLLLAGREWNVGQLSVYLKGTQPAISHHMSLLRHGGLVQPRREGKHTWYSLTDSGRRLAGVVRAALGEGLEDGAGGADPAS